MAGHVGRIDRARLAPFVQPERFDQASLRGSDLLVRDDLSGCRLDSVDAPSRLDKLEVYLKRDDAPDDRFLALTEIAVTAEVGTVLATQIAIAARPCAAAVD